MIPRRRLPPQDSDVLNSMKAIAAFMGYSEDFVRTLYRNYGLPARKLGNRYISDKQLIREWINHITKSDGTSILPK